MGSVGDMVLDLSVDTAGWKDGFADANSVLDGFAAKSDSVLNAVAQGSHQLATVAKTSAISIGSLAMGIASVGGSASGLMGVGRALLGISGIANNVTLAFKNLRSGTTYTQKLTGSIGAIGGAAGIAAIALKGVSFTMKRFGDDSTEAGSKSLLSLRGISAALKRNGIDADQLDGISKNLSRVATGATVAILGIRGISASINVMRSAAGVSIGAVSTSFSALRRTISTIPSAVGAVTGSMQRLGSAGVRAMRSGASAVGSFAASAGDSLGQLGQGISQVASGFAFGGAVGGLAALVGALLAAGVTAKSLGIDTSALAAPFEKLQAAFMKIASGVGQTAIAAITATIQRAMPYVEAYATAITIMSERFTSEWLPAIEQAVQSASNLFSGFYTEIETEWGAWISDSVSALAEFVENIDVYFEIAQQSIVLFASNGMLQMSDLFSNIGTWLVWFGENWSDVLTSAANLAGTIFQNIGKNLVEVFTKIWDWVSSGFQGELNIDFTPLTDGFKSTIKEWPKLLDTELAETSPELEALYKKLGGRQAAAAARGSSVGDAATPPTTEEPKPMQSKRESRSYSVGAAFIGSQEAATIAMRGVGGPNLKSTDDILKQQLKESKNQTGILKTNGAGKPLQIVNL